MSGPADAPVPPPPPGDAAPRRDAAASPARLIGPAPRTHWAVLAAGVVVLGGQVLLQEMIAGPLSPAWLFPLLTATYVLALAFIVAGIVGWLLARYLTAMLPSAAADPVAAAWPEPGDEPTDEAATPVAPAPSAAAGHRRRPVATRITRPTARTGEAPADDDHSLWRP